MIEQEIEALKVRGNQQPNRMLSNRPARFGSQRRRESSIRGSLKVSVFCNGHQTTRKLAWVGPVETQLMVLVCQRLWRTCIASVLSSVSCLVCGGTALHSPRMHYGSRSCLVKATSWPQGVKSWYAAEIQPRVDVQRGSDDISKT